MRENDSIPQGRAILNMPLVFLLTLSIVWICGVDLVRAEGPIDNTDEKTIEDEDTDFVVPELNEGFFWEEDRYRFRIWGELKNLTTYNNIKDNSLLTSEYVTFETRFSNDTEAKLKLDANILDKIGLFVRGRASNEYTKRKEKPTNEHENNLDQAYISFESGDEIATFLSVGKQRIKWGTGFYWNPVDTFNPRQNLQDKEDIEEGKVCYRADILFPVFSLSGIVVPNVNGRSFSLENFKPEKDKTLLTGKIYAFLWNTDMTLYVSDKEDEANRWGASFSTVISDVQFFGEGVFWKGNSEKYYPKLSSTRTSIYDPIGNTTFTLPASYRVNTKNGRFFKLVLGLQYTFANDITLISEYYHTNDGYDKEEMDTYIQSLKYAQAIYEDDVRSTVLAKQINPLLSIPEYSSKNTVLATSSALYDFANLRRNYLHFSLRKPYILNRFDLGMDLITNLDDFFENREKSLFLRPTIAYTALENWRFTLYSQMFIGAEDTEFGMLGYDYSIFAAAQFFF